MKSDAEYMRDTRNALMNGLVIGGFVAFALGACGAFWLSGRTSDKREAYWIDERNHARETGRLEGRCIELCRPEKFIELVNGNKECLCVTKRVRLAP